MTYSAPAERAIRGRILLVEPDDVIRAEYRQLFDPATCDLVEATDGRDAMAKAFVRRPTAVITELRLPGVDGCSLCEVFRQDVATRDVPLLVVTSEEDGSALARARRLADAVLPKPVDSDALLGEVLRLLNGEPNESVRDLDLQPSPGAAAETSRRRLIKKHERFFTATPPRTPPVLKCPSCFTRLRYERSFIGGVNERHSEQWDYYVCDNDATHYQYRQRTNKVRPL
jgi:CheY-like chemotaxis protein